jgi:uncharacterized protein YecT (DUF1311 family)
MKHIAFLLLFFSFAQHAFAQDYDADLAKMKKQWTAEIEAEMLELGIGVSDPETWMSDYDSLYDMYERDTFLLERLYDRQMDYDQSTHGIVQTMVDCEAGYDLLLNKYYKLLMSRLEGADKEILKKSQRNWIAFRDSEEELNRTLVKEEYTGGGTMYRMTYAARNLSTVQQRVEELFLYLIP